MPATPTPANSNMTSGQRNVRSRSTRARPTCIAVPQREALARPWRPTQATQNRPTWSAGPPQSTQVKSAIILLFGTRAGRAVEVADSVRRVPTLVLLRHGQSVWNREDLFTGWTDVDLSETGVDEARQAGRALRHAGVLPTVVHTSVLTRAIRTADLALE